MYSMLGGKYSRIFVGLTEGWYQPGAVAPSPEDIAAHIHEIDDRTHMPCRKAGCRKWIPSSLLNKDCQKRSNEPGCAARGWR